MALEICAYRGDGSDLSTMITETWTRTYGGRAWFPLWDKAFVEWRMMDPRILDREMLVCAYDDQRLVGCLLGEQTDLRIGAQVVPGSLTSYLSVDPTTRHHGLALRLLERQRILHGERGLRLSLGVSNSRGDLASKKFWDVVGRRWPHEHAVLGRLTLWSAVVDAAAVAGAGLTTFEKLGSRAASVLPWGWFGARGATTRPFRADDLDACTRWTQRQGEAADCQMIWSRQRLAVQLDHPYARTWIAERGGKAWGFANGYLIDWSGARVVRIGFIELCVADGGVLAHASLFVAAGRALAAEGAQMIVVMSAGTQPHTALLAAGFMPMDPHVQTMALLGEMATALPPRARLHWAFT